MSDLIIQNEFLPQYKCKSHDSSHLNAYKLVSKEVAVILGWDLPARKSWKLSQKTSTTWCGIIQRIILCNTDIYCTYIVWLTGWRLIASPKNIFSILLMSVNPTTCMLDLIATSVIKESICPHFKHYHCISHYWICYSGTVLEWFGSYLSDRSQIIWVLGNNKSNIDQVCHGVPQGSVLVAKLFSIYMLPLGQSNVSDSNLLSWVTLNLISDRSAMVLPRVLS